VVERLLTLRSIAYESLADVTIETDGRSVDAVADVVLEQVA
jgi:hypothetical protein